MAQRQTWASSIFTLATNVLVWPYSRTASLASKERIEVLCQASIWFRDAFIDSSLGTCIVSSSAQTPIFVSPPQSLPPPPPFPGDGRITTLWFRTAALCPPLVPSGPLAQW
ncbi:hypothetical protein CSUB01_10938 [Colletotrichum sublineola]|uniref:Uncharacterized protein n=1 Tax=Colletotrichum sublineola TaxID=1173701 RepID=A0A066X2V6_COLSU|nr:hypothetical protein CSUB01_10938 [Colletotrichum sublineola]